MTADGEAVSPPLGPWAGAWPAIATAAAAGFLMSLFLELLPNPHGTAPLYIAPASALIAVPVGVLLVLVPGRRRVGDAVVLAVVMVAAAAPVLAFRFLTNDYDTGSYQRGLGRRELAGGFLAMGVAGVVVYGVAAAFIYDRWERRRDARALQRLGLWIASCSLAGVASAATIHRATSPDFFFAGRDNGATIGLVFAATTAIALLAAIGARLNVVAAPLACWPAWMTVVLLQERRGWDLDVSQGDMARECIQYALVNTAVAAGVIAAAFFVQRSTMPGRRSGPPESRGGPARPHECRRARAPRRR